jgi:hypothetical protein
MMDGEGFVPGPLCRLLVADHDRSMRLLDAATARPDVVEPAPYAAFRARLLRHIGVEEKILLPAAQRAQDGVALAIAARLRLEHGAIATLLVPTPTPTIVAALRDILARHDGLEEGPGGVYATCERLLGPSAGALIAEIRAARDVRVNAHVNGPLVMDAVARALARAGYELRDYTRRGNR